MTTTSIAARPHQADAARWRPVRADLAFWAAAGAVVAALSAPLAHLWQVSHTVLLFGGLSFAILGPILLVGLHRSRPVSGGLVTGFVVTISYWHRSPRPRHGSAGWV